MRQITRQAVNAFYRWENFSLNNTQVKMNEWVSEMFLHGNLIAIYNLSTWELKISNAGWKTTITKERLNWILYSHPHTDKFQIKQTKWMWYIVNILNNKPKPFFWFTSFNFKTF